MEPLVRLLFRQSYLGTINIKEKDRLCGMLGNWPNVHMSRLLSRQSSPGTINIKEKDRCVECRGIGLMAIWPDFCLDNLPPGTIIETIGLAVGNVGEGTRLNGISG